MLFADGMAASDSFMVEFWLNRFDRQFGKRGRLFGL
jgi:hypothetical protein